MPIKIINMPYTRSLEKRLKKSLKTSPIVYINGARQSGKSTLSKEIIKKNYITFDNPFILENAKRDPQNFINSLDLSDIVALDEIQLIPEIFRLLKIQVDLSREKNKKTGIFLLTGSANLMALPTLSNALVGRMNILTLYPFSASEYLKTEVNFVKNIFNTKLKLKEIKTHNLFNIIKNSTFPEIATNSKIDRVDWFNDYITTLVQRDVKNISDIQHPEKLISLLGIFASTPCGLLNDASIKTKVGLNSETYYKYKALLINTFINFEIKPFFRNHKKRFIKSPKMYFTDTNLLVYAMRENLKDIMKNNHSAMGNVFENFVATELLKAKSLINDVNIYHFRTYNGKEVDFVLEKIGGDIVGIEVKYKKSITTDDIKGLRELKEITGKKFNKGIVIYTGNQILPIEKDIWAVPVDLLWNNIKP